MIPVAFYVLRERTRPTEAEATSFFTSCALQKEGVDLSSGGRFPIHIATTLRPSGDLRKDFEAFIRQSGGEKYQGKPRQYEWGLFEAQTGNPPELTYLAVVYALREAKSELAFPPPTVQEFLARGARWEALERWGDALLCYLIAAKLYPDDLELKLRYGKAQLRHRRLVGAAYRPLMEVAESRPCSAEAAAALAECYILIADDPETEVRGSTRDELRDWALTHLERAMALAPDDGTVLARWDQLRQRLDADPALNFFSTE